MELRLGSKFRPIRNNAQGSVDQRADRFKRPWCVSWEKPRAADGPLCVLGTRVVHLSLPPARVVTGVTTYNLSLLLESKCDEGTFPLFYYSMWQTELGQYISVKYE